MESIELSEYPILPGIVTHWMARADLSLEEWPEDDRCASYVHEAHLRGYASASSDARESWIGTAFEFEGHLDHEAIRRTLRLWVDQHEVLRSQVSLRDPSQPSSSPLIRRTLPVGAVDFEPVSAGPLRSSTAVHRELSHMFDVVASPLNWPGYLLSTVERDDGTITIVFVADHSLLDGYSQVLVSTELAELYKKVLEEGLDYAPEPSVVKDSYVDFSAAEREAAQSVTAEHPAVRAWAERVAEGDAMDFPLPLSDPKPHRGLVHQRPYNTWLLDSEQCDAFFSACKSFGGGYNAGIAAAMALATKLTSDRDRLSFVTPLDTRSDMRWAQSIGWFVGTAPVSVDLRAADSFSALVPVAQQSYSSTRLVSSVPFAKVCEVLSEEIKPSFIASFNNASAMAGADQWLQQRMRALRSKNYSDTEVFMALVRFPALGLSLSARYPNTFTAASSVHRFFSALRTVMVAVAHHGDFHVQSHPRFTRQSLVAAV
ncbi:condensation domain protein [Segniliparus rotundus DSM 44985]|uniref:Condensation domain protein n=1 Tax=Segniliparus rotundus (strain ATCC BAA-972 / CDC 1076 / CIP 108378 / DSM 44985 / JCM 13578) TaxID=640132 RepID=D6ZCU2_SEGRD|nr:condensation domain-containing protein [Segniliparus rotundus]ADG97134.1 condensation domain protein [Segniliparus rotundus DSM 44985]